MIEGLVSGKVYGRPEQRVGNNSGKPFVTAKVRAATAGGGEMLFVNVLAFDAQAQLALSDGDGVSLAGTLTPKVWIDRENWAPPTLSLIASQVLTVYQVTRKREAVASVEQPRKPDAPPRQRNYSPPVPAAEAKG
jgi:hypothetical protein